MHHLLCFFFFFLLNLLFFAFASAQSALPPPTTPTPTPCPSTGNCPIDALKLGVCTNLLGGLVNVTLGAPPVTPCCNLLQGLVDLDVVVCLCIAIRANILGINLNIPIALSSVLNNCGRNNPTGFQCR
ncbi:hypothetical protein LOK49_LG11G02388 [Camellia lanceoleosa]|uniref:Uncharacterized protein n=1 Tax=Camellia lanceoleosa TaxID=1840588 RepID=A0ACC0G017_9ERIC|nr:hypothetical protein LOK49_LG11G02388 [Camellia lanceoleosa]